MFIKTRLNFRECSTYINNDGESMLRLRFLDNNDDSYTFFVKDNDENKKFKTMKKDTELDLQLILYKSQKGKYSLYADFGG